MKTIIALLALCSVALADPPKLEIKGPTSVIEGAMIMLDASGSDADRLNWIVDTSGVDMPCDEATRDELMRQAAALEAAGFEVIDRTDGEPLVFITPDRATLHTCSYRGTLRVLLMGSNSDDVVGLPWTITITPREPLPPKPDPTPDPEPDPDPDPTPPPPLPDLSALVSRELAAVLNESNRGEFTLLYAAYETAAAEIDNGTLTTVDAALDRVLALTKLYMPTHFGEWQPIVTKVETRLDQLQDAGQFDTSNVKSYAPMFRQVSAGVFDALN